MEKEITFSAGFNGKLLIDYLPCVNYAMVLNDGKAFNKFFLRNSSDSQTWEGVRIRVAGDMIEPSQFEIETLRPGHVVNFENANLIPVASKLMALTEAVQTSFTITISIGEQTVGLQSFPLMLMAFDQWHGLTIMPELLAAFVTPNHPCIPPVCLRASKYLEEMSGNRDLDEYMSMDYQRVANQVEGMYRALLDENITYITAPPSFEPYGQRIRLVDKVLKDKLGNCMELSLLMCSCLESIGIRTMMILFKGHAIMGVWLDPNANLPMVGYDVLPLVQYSDNSQKYLLLIETTALTRGESLTEAIRQGDECMKMMAHNFEFYVDIRMARYNHVRPLPHSILSEQGWEIKDTTDYDALFDEIATHNPYDIHGTNSTDKQANKQLLWERKLLDLSLRNNLLNMKSGKRIIPLKDFSIAEILKHLESGVLAGDLDEKDEFATIKELYRAARNSIEENGANTLFLSIGTLRWYEQDGTKPYFAPIMFLPIEMVRHGARKYIIRKRDEEPIINVTLMEMMRQTFELEVPKLSPIPEDENEQVDWHRVFDILNTTLSEVNEKRTDETKWEIVEECMIGIFSFTKFVMWNDIHSNPQILRRHPLLKGLMEGVYEVNSQRDENENIDDIQPCEIALPLDTDSSQLEAIVNSEKGKSFILYGPPGTGKSQTIANMISNALYHGKRVLFVSEKKAALEVVQERLKKIGLEPFCLELHSNKVDKKFFLSQMEMALNVPLEASAIEFEKKSDELYARRQELNAYVNSLHSERREGLSLYDYINRYLDIQGEAMELSYNDIEHLTLEQVNELSSQLEALDTIESIIGQHPGQHPLLGLYPKENTAENQRQVIAAISEMPTGIQAAKKKEQGLLNRWFFKRTSMEIFKRRVEWGRFCAVASTDQYIHEDIEILCSIVQTWNQHTNKLRLWYHYSIRAQEIAKFNVDAVMKYYLSGHSGRETAEAFRKGYFLALATNILENDSSLRSFNGMLFEDVIKKYRSLADKFKQLTQKELVCRLSQRTPRAESANRQTNEEIAFLRKRIAANGRAYSVRRMLDQTRHILPQLCPCMLMSPLSVAQYLEMSGDQFDLILFDEASQMPTSEAVGTIARGRTVVVVGDPKQMPPTSFFTASNTNDDDADIDDLESILDDCISLSLPGHYLSWHYRSKHESLIAFSNVHFYDGKLATFPSVDDQERKVTLQHVDGVYDFGRTRSNKIEAKAVVDEVISRLEYVTNGSAQYRSIGIVAFSKVQANMIEDLLLDALSKRPDIEKLALKSDEPIFIKNLENVQGDERDIILFSVGYGPDKTGKISMNFGPLNQLGGERRLNVAVSRARCEMKVFSTLQSQHIDLQRTSAKGVLGLKRFLEYAETGILPQPAVQVEKTKVDPVTEAVAEQYQKEGYEVHTNVGRSRFKIDVALVDKENPTTYERGILLDGPTYSQTSTARDREIVRPFILTSLGWNLERKWTIDYYG